MRSTKIKGESVMRGNLPKPIKKQREVLYMPSAGHTVAG